jgi:septal ring factor EnvC (AmiA/AmiB activator)
MRSLVLSLTLVAVAFGAKNTDKAEADKEADLKQLRTRIEAIRQTMQTDATRRDALAGELLTADFSIRNARDQGTEIRKQRQASERKLADLRRDQAFTEKLIAEQRDTLASELQVAYMNGHEEQLKLTLNQQSPAELGRMLAYYGYFGRARAEQIAAIGERLAQLQLLGETIQAETQRLREIEVQQEAQVKELAGARRQRAQTLATIQSTLRSHNDQLAALTREAASLERLLEELRRATDDFPVTARQSFDKFQGKLPWPVNGKIIARFGELRAGGPLKWKGMLLEANAGAQVRAPLHGRVEYADWLNGYGYLVVLNHGGGLRSFYGHNEQLYCKVGDMVEPGDVLGDLAERGGGKADFYLEIRKAEKPVDPQKWLRKP